MICSHLATLYDTLFEQNLLWIIKPNSGIEIGYVISRLDRVDKPSTKYIVISLFYFILFIFYFLG